MDTKGRIKILSDLIPTGDLTIDRKMIPVILENTLSEHNKNLKDIQKLEDYYYNRTAIQYKTKTRQEKINNKININYPSIAVTTINAYCFANPLSISSRNANKNTQIKALKDCLDDDNYYAKSNDMYLQSAIKALGYRYIVPASGEEIKNGIYFHTRTHFKPEDTYCVYSNDTDQEKIMAVHFYNKTKYSSDYKTKTEYKVYDVWTKYHKWRFSQIGGNGAFSLDLFTVNNGVQDVVIDAMPIASGKIPVVENIRKADRTGDFELAIDLVDAINALASSRLDAVQQNVDYLITLRDIDIWSEGALDKVKDAIKEGIMAFKSVQNATVQPEIDVLETKLNQSEVQTLQNFLCEKLEEVMNIPNRETRSSGGDTGSAVESRNGFRSLENIAGLVSSNAKATETETLDVILAICSNIKTCPFKDLTSKDIEIKENRNKVENMVNSANAYAVLRSAGLNDVTALETSKIVNDSQAVADMNKKEAEEKAKQEQKSLQKPNAGVGNNNTPIESGSNSQKADE